MSGINRRSFLAFGAAIPLSTWLERTASAQGVRKYVRYDARSADGKKMLKSYATAVSRMKKLEYGDPASWTFQWYTHWIKGPQIPYSDVLDTKLAALSKIESKTHRELAKSMWDNCQAHGAGVLPDGGDAWFPPENENYFLPWHRIYVYFFERIVRKYSDNPDFTLPYWNYSTLDMSIRGVIPPEFIMANDQTFGPLYQANRNPWINEGQPIRGDLTPGSPNDLLSLAALLQAQYEPSSEQVRGFNETLDSGLHGNIHVGVGGRENMGYVPTAAQDPIFWLHHCNIDRLWASWNAANHSNPYYDQTYVFADENGQRVVAKLADFTNLDQLGYTYDHPEKVPASARHFTAEAVKTQVPKIRAAGQKIALGERSTNAGLEIKAEKLKVPQALAVHVRSLAANGRVFLVVKDLQADSQPGVLYNLYLDLPEQANDEQKRAHAVGVLNFFHAHGPAMGGHGKPNAEAAGQGHGGMSASFDITDVLRSLQQNNRLAEAPTLTIVPVGSPDAAAKPVIGDVSIVEV